MSNANATTAIVRAGLAAALLAGASCRDGATTEPPVGACTVGDEPLRLGFYAFYAPVSYSADSDPGSAGFSTHLGYEADLLDALESMEDARLSFVRAPVAEWPGIWLLPSTPDFDMVGGGISILESRTRNAAGEQVVAFTSGHIAFRQSLLVRAEDAERFSSYSALTEDVRVGVIRATTGETRLLQVTGLVDAEGRLAAGTRVVTPSGTIVADGSADYVITAAHASAVLEDRTHIHPPSADKPQVVYLGDAAGDEELLAALRDGTIDAMAGDQIGHGEATHASGGNLAVSVLDSLAEHGGFSLSADEGELVACIDERLVWLTDDGGIGYAEWRADPSVFASRAQLWNAR